MAEQTPNNALTIILEGEKGNKKGTLIRCLKLGALSSAGIPQQTPQHLHPCALGRWSIVLS